MQRKLRTFAYLAAGHAALVVGVIGIFVPLLPTTPFLLIAGFCYERGSPRLHAWLRGHRYVGRYITAWEDRGVIPLRAKIFAVTMIALATAYIVYAAPLIAVKVGMLVVALVVSGYILSRPSE